MRIVAWGAQKAGLRMAGSKSVPEHDRADFQIEIFRARALIHFVVDRWRGWYSRCEESLCNVFAPGWWVMSSEWAGPSVQQMLWIVAW